MRRILAGLLLIVFAFLTFQSAASYPVRPENVLRRQDRPQPLVLCVRVRDTTQNGFLLAYMKKAARGFEKTQKRLNLYVEEVTQQALDDGIQADLLVFTHGARLSGKAMQPLMGIEGLCPAYLASGFYEGSLRALPFATDGYFLMQNIFDHAGKKELKGQNKQEQNPCKQNDILCPSLNGHSTLCAYASHDAVQEPIFKQRSLLWPTFILEGKGKTYIGTGGYELRRMEVLQKSGKALAVKPTLAPCAYTDLTCYASIPQGSQKDNPKLRASCCAAFLAYLLSPEGQSLLPSFRLHTVKEGLCLYPSDTPMGQLEKALKETCLIPNVFAFSQKALPQNLAQAQAFLKDPTLFAKTETALQG